MVGGLGAERREARGLAAGRRSRAPGEASSLAGGAAARPLSALCLAALCALSLGGRAQAGDYERGDYHLVRRPGPRVVAELQGEVEVPRLEASEWILYAPRAPKHALSEPSAQRLWRVLEGGKERRGERWRDPRGRELWRSVKPAAKSERRRLTYRVRYELQSFQVELRGGRGPEPAPTPEAAELAPYLRANEVFALEHPEFRAWLRRKGLVRRKGERDLAFAWRALQAIEAGFRYAYPPASPERRCDQVIADGASDCGGLSGLLVAILRANQVPARLLVGRWVQPDRDDEQQWHVKAEFFAQGVGWVPCDGSGAVTWRGKAGAAFGRTGGPFFVMHLDNQLELDTVYWGRETVRVLQGVVWWVRGAGSLEGKQSSSRWVVRLAGAEADAGRQRRGR